jgi:serine/threonine protein kinase
LLLDFMGGGEMFFWLRKCNQFSLKRAKLYAAEIVLALEFLHSNDTVYRDLKPENIMIDDEGHACICDFGLAKSGVTAIKPGDATATNSIVGTPEYLAPEQVKHLGHGKAVDWWTLGQLLFEMVAGFCPFSHDDMRY